MLKRYSFEEVIQRANKATGLIPPEFCLWLTENYHVWDAFVGQTEAVIDAGLKHYSARTIIHVLRHHSALRETGSAWKLNNDTSPYLARLFAILYPGHGNLFEYRTTNIERLAA